jgi:hypothetical protein
MSKIIPNENSWIGFTTVAPASLDAPTETEIDAATNLTPLIVSLNPTAQGNAAPTPALDSLFDRSIIGTSQGSFSGDFYRDNPSDLAWTTLPRGTVGYFFVSRFGGTGALKKPRAGDKLEVWPVIVTQRAGSAMTSNTVQTFTLAAAVPEPPEENAVCAAGGSAITGYKLYKSTVAGGGGAYTEITTNKTVIGTTAALTAVTAGLTYFKVKATNSSGDSDFSDFASCTVAA